MVPGSATSDAECPGGGGNGDHADPAVMSGSGENAGRGAAIESSKPAEVLILSSMRAAEDANDGRVGVAHHGGELQSSSNTANTSGITTRGGGIHPDYYQLQQRDSLSARTIRGVENNRNNCRQPDDNKRPLPEQEDNAENALSSAFSLANSIVTPSTATTSAPLNRNSTSRGIRRSRSFDGTVQHKSKVARTAFVASGICRRRGVGGGVDGTGEHALPGGGWANGGVDHRTPPKSSSAEFAQAAAVAGGGAIGLAGESGRWHPGIGVIGVEDGECGVAARLEGNFVPPVGATELLKDEGLKEAFAARGRHKKGPVLAR